MKTLSIVSCLFVIGIGAGSSQAAGFKVARVQSSTPILLKEYVHWAKVSGMTQSSTPGSSIVAVPPRYGSCIKAMHKKGMSMKKSWAKCRETFKTYNLQVMQLLVTSAWIKGEAHERGLSVSKSQVLAQFKKTKKDAFPSEKDFQMFLRSSGETVGDLVARIKVDMLSEAIRKDVTKGLSGAQATSALELFVPRFQSKWKLRTTCNHNFAISLCGHTN